MQIRIPQNDLSAPDHESGLTTAERKPKKQRGRQIRDLTGQTFGKLRVIKRTDKRQQGSVVWLCECACTPGEYFGVKSAALVQGLVRSCGCSTKWNNKVLEDQYQPNCERLYLYRIWYLLATRCVNTVRNTKKVIPAIYRKYNIKLYSAWLHFDQFYQWAMHNGYKTGSTLHRHDLYSDYTPENCYWRPYGDYENNNPGTRIIEYQGKRQSISRWARELGIDPLALRHRLKVCNDDLEEVLSITWDQKHTQEAARETRARHRLEREHAEGGWKLRKKK